MRSLSNAIAWITFIAILLAGLVFVMPGIADQIIYHDECHTKGGVFTYNGHCVEEIPLEKNG
jgi:hypothetical protein